MKLLRKNFQILTTSNGYTILYKGTSIGGFNAFHKNVIKQPIDFIKDAEKDIQKILIGYLGRYKSELEKIIFG